MSITMRKGKFGNRYQVKIKGTDGKWMTKTFATKTEARAYKNKLEYIKISGEKLSGRINKLLIRDYWNQWIKHTNSNVSEGWRIKQKQMYRDYIEAEIGNLKLLSVTPIDISKVLIKMKRKGRSPQTIIHVYGMLHKLFDDSVELFEYRSSNPVKKRLKPKVITKETEYLEYDEIIKLLSYVDGKSYGSAIWLQVLCGLRVGEVMYLKWNHVDFLNTIINIRGTWRRSEKRFVDHPKGKKWFSVTIPPELLVKLKICKLNQSSEYVVPSIAGDIHMSYNWYFKILKKYCKDAGVNTKIGTHGLRHSASVIYMENGATREDMQMLFDHSSKETTVRYIHGKYKKKSQISKIAGVIKLFPEALSS